jgi:sulfoxide reductase catalytic subunit YedY
LALAQNSGPKNFAEIKRHLRHLTAMFNIIKRPGWHIPDRSITPESIYRNRRSFLKQMGWTGVGLLAAPIIGDSQAAESPTKPAAKTNSSAAKAGASKYPAAKNPAFSPDWPLTDEKTAATYNNFYEFTTVKDRVHRMVDRFVTSPWPIEISGLVDKPMTLDVQELIDQIALEERVYRLRCVEAWAMIVPWTGFPLSKLIEKVSPKAEAKFLRFVTFNNPLQAPGLADPSYPWPYTEGLRIDEAMHPLTLLATGIYGKPMPKQHGAPIRIVVPWKYGFKSIKSIVKIEFVARQPKTLWETMAPNEYPFESNVNPAIDHPRWSQKFERMIDTGIRVKTQPFNGYGDQVAKLYASK